MLAASALTLSAASAREPSSDWRRVKCERYTRDWREALARGGTEGLSPGFIARHEAFLAGGCVGPADVCPRSARELDLANILVIRAMNAGMASTFPPFACRQ